MCVCASACARAVCVCVYTLIHVCNCVLCMHSCMIVCGGGNVCGYEYIHVAYKCVVLTIHWVTSILHLGLYDIWLFAAKGVVIH